MRSARIIFIAILLAFVACDKAFENGELDGMWKLERVCSSGNEYCPADIYYSFQRHLATLGKYYEQASPFLYLAEFDYSGDVITMTNFKAHPGIENVCNKDDLALFYIYNEVSETFVIDRLDDDMLIMHTGNAEYCFRRW